MSARDEVVSLRNANRTVFFISLTLLIVVSIAAYFFAATPWMVFFVLIGVGALGLALCSLLFWLGTSVEVYAGDKLEKMK